MIFSFKCNHIFSAVVFISLERVDQTVRIFATVLGICSAYHFTIVMMIHLLGVLQIWAIKSFLLQLFRRYPGNYLHHRLSSYLDVVSCMYMSFADTQNADGLVAVSHALAPACSVFCCRVAAPPWAGCICMCTLSPVCPFLFVCPSCRPPIYQSAR